MSSNIPVQIPIEILIDGIVTNDPQLLDALRAINNSMQITQARLQSLAVNLGTTQNQISGSSRWGASLLLMGG